LIRQQLGTTEEISISILFCVAVLVSYRIWIFAVFSFTTYSIKKMFFRSLRGVVNNQRAALVATVGSTATAWSWSTQQQEQQQQQISSTSRTRSFCERAAPSATATATATATVPPPARGNAHGATNEPSKSQSQYYYTPDQVAERNGAGDQKEIWVSFQGKVYDITDFVAEHPGGSIIRNAAGGPLENYWAYWAYHSLLDRPMNSLKNYEIGVLLVPPGDDEDDDEVVQSLKDIRQEMYAGDPNRQESIQHGQIALCYQPWCSETAPRKQETLYTRNQAFYVRNHAPVPDLEKEDYSITISSQLPNYSQKTIFLENLSSRYPVVTVPSILQCAGNRSADLMAVAPTAFAGTPFSTIQTGLMGNAEWKGVKLADVLLELFPFLRNLSAQELDQYHVEFEGADQYRTSTSIGRILDSENDVILCTEMNGQPLPRDHGYPVRVLLPGIAGCRSVKWLHAIRLLPAESDSCFQKTYYLDPNGRAIQEMPMQAFVTSKEKKTNVATTRTPNEIKQREEEQWTVRGIAWGGGSGVGISAVQVSTNGGETWQTVDKEGMHTCLGQDASKQWSWVQWETVVQVPAAANAATAGTQGQVKFTCRAFDGKGLQQPQRLWYPKGYLSNGWHTL
jgi:sulfite oxidase